MADRILFHLISVSDNFDLLEMSVCDGCLLVSCQQSISIYCNSNTSTAVARVS